MIRVYIASPYTIGDVAVNVKKQLDTANILIDHGFAPFVPLYSHFQHMAHPQPYEKWTELDNVWLLQCQAVLRLPGESKGADAEVALATQNNIPIFYDIMSLLTWSCIIVSPLKEDMKSEKLTPTGDKT